MIFGIELRLVRRYIYALAAAVWALLVYLGMLDPDAWPLVGAVILALLNTRPPATPDELPDEL